MRRTRLLVLILVGLCATPASAQVRAGMLEFDANFWFEYSDSESRSSGFRSEGKGWTGLISSHAGYLVTDRIDVGGSAGFSYADFDGGAGNSRSYSIGPAINWHFRTEHRIVPLVGLFARWRWDKQRGGYGDRDVDGWEIEAAGGADFFLNEHVAFRARAVLNHFERDSESETSTGPYVTENEVDELRVEVGVAVFLDLRLRDG